MERKDWLYIFMHLNSNLKKLHIKYLKINDLHYWRKRNIIKVISEAMKWCAVKKWMKKRRIVIKMFHNATKSMLFWRWRRMWSRIASHLSSHVCVQSIVSWWRMGTVLLFTPPNPSKVLKFSSFNPNNYYLAQFCW